MRSKALVWLACTAVLLSLLSACGSGDNGYTVDDDKAVYPEAIALYQTNCLTCHGNALQGRVGPETDLSQVGARLDRDAIIAIVKEGGDRMPAFENVLSEEDMQALADWLAAKK